MGPGKQAGTDLFLAENIALSEVENKSVPVSSSCFSLSCFFVERGARGLQSLYT